MCLHLRDQASTCSVLCKKKENLQKKSYYQSFSEYIQIPRSPQNPQNRTASNFHTKKITSNSEMQLEYIFFCKI